MYLRVKDVNDNNLIFDYIKNVKLNNILFGGNGVGKSTLLNYIDTHKIELVGSDDEIIDYEVISYKNSIENLKYATKTIEERKWRNEFSTKDMIKYVHSQSLSEGQSMIYYRKQKRKPIPLGMG